MNSLLLEVCVPSENLQKIRGFCHGTAILDELHRTVADGAIRDAQTTVSTHLYVAATVRR
jgi:hypothetical protein